MAFSTTKIQKVSISPVLLVSWLYFINKATASYSSGDSKTVTVQAHLPSPHLLLRSCSLSSFFPFPCFLPLSFSLFFTLIYNLVLDSLGTRSTTPLEATHFLPCQSAVPAQCTGQRATHNNGFQRPITRNSLGWRDSVSVYADPSFPASGCIFGASLLKQPCLLGSTSKASTAVFPVLPN